MAEVEMLLEPNQLLCATSLPGNGKPLVRYVTRSAGVLQGTMTTKESDAEQLRGYLGRRWGLLSCQ